MKKFVTLLILCLGLVVSCYDDTALIERIDALEQTTIAALQTSITALEAKYTELKDSIVPSSEIENKISELKEWMEKLINGYYTKEEIDQQLKLLNTEIKTLETLINSLIGDFAIEFDNSEIGILAGGTTSVGYTITGATEKTTVKALGQNGWSAKVTPEGTDKGKITITAPNPLTEDEIIVLVYDGEYRTIMSSINFVTGVVTPSQTAVELEAEAGTVDITVTSNLNYKVSIPDEAKEWFSVVETKATKTETITFAYTSNNGNIRRCLVNFTDNDGKIISSVTFVQKKVIVMEDAIDLSANGTANCYMIPEAGWFKFNASVKGNSQESVGELSGVEVLWETFNTNEKPQEGDIVSKVLLSENYVYLKTSDDYKNGNALIAVKDINGVILWSWHIWVTDYDPLTSYDTYVASQAIMMNRDLGALTTTQGDTRTLGLFFQWGRKDPFFGDDFQSTLSSYSIEESSAEKGTTIYATNNPTTFITYTSRTDADWHYNYRDNNLWAIDKTIYDPCPNGWKVPEWSYYSGGNSDGLWNTGVWLNFYSPDNKDAVFDSNLKGIMFSTYYSIPETWYQCHGELSADYGIRKNVRSGRWWAVMDSQSTITSGGSRGLTISSSGAMTNSSQGRATGNIIRCQKE